MKTCGKIIVLALALVMLLSVCACGAKTEEASGVKVIDYQLTSEEYAYAVTPSKPELVDSLNAFLEESMSNGVFDEIIDHYFGDGEPVEVVSAEQDSSKDQLLVVTEPGFEPFEYTSGDKYLGVDMEMMAAFAEYLGKELVIITIDFDSIFETLNTDGADIGAAGITYNEARAQLVNFSNTYYNAAQKVIVKASDSTFDDCSSAEEVEAILKGFDSKVKIGVQAGTTGNSYVDGSEDFGFDGLTAVSVGYTTPSLAVTAMLNGDVDYVIADEAPAECIARAINALQ